MNNQKSKSNSFFAVLHKNSVKLIGTSFILMLIFPFIVSLNTSSNSFSTQEYLFLTTPYSQKWEIVVIAILVTAFLIGTISIIVNQFPKKWDYSVAFLILFMITAALIMNIAMPSDIGSSTNANKAEEWLKETQGLTFVQDGYFADKLKASDDFSSKAGALMVDDKKEFYVVEFNIEDSQFSIKSKTQVDNDELSTLAKENK